MKTETKGKLCPQIKMLNFKFPAHRRFNDIVLPLMSLLQKDSWNVCPKSSCFGTEQHAESRPRVVHATFFRYLNGSLYTSASWSIFALPPSLPSLLSLMGSYFKSKEHHKVSCASQSIRSGQQWASSSCLLAEAFRMPAPQRALILRSAPAHAGENQGRASTQHAHPSQHPTSYPVKGTSEKNASPAHSHLRF